MHTQETGRSTPRANAEVALGDPSSAGAGWERVENHWRELAGEPWFIGDLYAALAKRFVRSVRIEDPDSFYRATGQGGVLYLANHQNLLESLFFTTVMTALTNNRIGTMIKIWIEEHWIGRLLTDAMRYPDFRPDALFPYRLFFFNDAEPRSLFRLLEEMKGFLREGASCMVHVEGTRAFSSRHRVTKISDGVIRLAIEAGVAIVPVRFSGGLPENDVEEKPIYPYRLVAQDIHLGQAIPPEALAGLSMKERKQAVLNAINGTGPDPDDERMSPVDFEFERAVRDWTEAAGCVKESAVLYQALKAADDTRFGSDTRDLLAGRGAAAWPDTPKGRWMARWAELLLGARGERLLAREEAANV